MIGKKGQLFSYFKKQGKRQDPAKGSTTVAKHIRAESTQEPT